MDPGDIAAKILHTVFETNDTELVIRRP